MGIPNEVVVNVKMRISAYFARAHGHSVSSTAGPKQAAERLAQKLWGPGNHIAYRLDSTPPDDERWCLMRSVVSTTALGRRHQVLTWVSVDDSKPDADTTVLIHAPDCDPPVWFGYWDGEDWYQIDDSGSTFVDRVAHWADLPTPPEAR